MNKISDLQRMQRNDIFFLTAAGIILQLHCNNTAFIHAGGLVCGYTL